MTPPAANDTTAPRFASRRARAPGGRDHSGVPALPPVERRDWAGALAGYHRRQAWAARRRLWRAYAIHLGLVALGALAAWAAGLF